ncbi:hypothetical protein E4U54_003865 [Claviceps lovelessii]|nr:hypothetical protein E4U54_003865 [Claviceps lovelessii]
MYHAYLETKSKPKHAQHIAQNTSPSIPAPMLPNISHDSLISTKPSSPSRPLHELASELDRPHSHATTQEQEGPKECDLPEEAIPRDLLHNLVLCDRRDDHVGAAGGQDGGEKHSK